MELLVSNFTKKFLFLLISRNFLAGAFMGFDSELEDSGSECDVEGQRQNAIKTAILGKLVKKSKKKNVYQNSNFFFQK